TGPKIHPRATVDSASPPDDLRRHDPRPGVAEVVTVSNGSALALRNTDAGGGRRPDIAGGMLSDHQLNINTGIPQQPASPIMDAVGFASSDPDVGARPPLPHRQPQQHLAPGLREDDSSEIGWTEARSPEEARERFARYQQAWANGRAASHDETVTRTDQGR